LIVADFVDVFGAGPCEYRQKSSRNNFPCPSAILIEGAYRSNNPNDISDSRMECVSSISMK